MNQIIEQFAKLTKPQKMIILIGLIAAVCALYYFVFYQPLVESLKQLQKTEADLVEKLTENRSIAKNIEKFKEELAVLDEELKQAVSLLPNDKDIRGLLRQISVLQKKTNINSLMFKPGNESRKGFYSEIPIELRVEGSYHDIAQFFDKVGKLERIVNINEISISSAKEAEGKIRLSVQCVATTFMFTGGA